MSDLQPVHPEKSTVRHVVDKTRNETSKYSAPALEKGLDILELFAQETDGLLQIDVARRLHRTTSEVFRMLVCLQHRGYIDQGEDERYRLTLRLFELAQNHPPAKRLTRQAIAVMHDVSAQTKQSCHLATIDQGAIVILAQVDAPSSIGFFVKPGSRLDLMLASSGYAILAHLHAQSRNRVVKQAQQHGSHIPDDLTAHLDMIRQRGFEERESYQVQGIINISFPVLDSHDEAIAALTVPFLPRLDTPTTTAEVIQALRKGANALSKAMGHTKSRNR